jgi:hypothetical protein
MKLKKKEKKRNKIDGRSTWEERSSARARSLQRKRAKWADKRALLKPRQVSRSEVKRSSP